jgi:hypothetical protein
MRRNTPPLLQRMTERQIGELIVKRTYIYEPKTGCRVAHSFPNEAAAINAALRMNEIVDWFGLLKARSEGHSPNCQHELQQIAENFGGKLATGNHDKLAERLCADAVAAVERT